jgi:hypothetical protein
MRAAFRAFLMGVRARRIGVGVMELGLDEDHLY